MSNITIVKKYVGKPTKIQAAYYDGTDECLKDIIAACAKSGFDLKVEGTIPANRYIVWKLDWNTLDTEGQFIYTKDEFEKQYDLVPFIIK